MCTVFVLSVRSEEREVRYYVLQYSESTDSTHTIHVQCVCVAVCIYVFVLYTYTMCTIIFWCGKVFCECALECVL